MGGGGSSPPEEIDQCEVMDDQLKEEYGDDFLTNREALPLTSQTLGYLASTPCESYFGYENLVKEFCDASIENFDQQVGNGKTCADHVGTDKRSKWCLLEKDRVPKDAKCSKSKLGDMYHATAVTWCQTYPEEDWCKCYNIKNNVCSSNPNASGCKYYTGLEQNRAYFGEDGYNILKEKGHCRPKMCDRGYIPENVISDCEPSYRICDKDINIQSASDGNIIVACNADFDDFEEPEWWGDDSESAIDKRCRIDLKEWFNKVTDSKEPSTKPGPIIDFNKFPLNKLPMTCLPGRLRWKDSNYRYLIYYTTTISSSFCCLLLILIMSSLKRR